MYRNRLRDGVGNDVQPLPDEPDGLLSCKRVSISDQQRATHSTDERVDLAAICSKLRPIIGIAMS